MLTIKKVLCPTDFSEPSLASLYTARELSASYDAELILVHVVPFPAPNERGFSSEQQASCFAQQEAEDKLCALVTGAEHYVIRVGDAATEIMDTAKAEGAHVIVMATHGLTGWRRLVVGSVAEKVLRQSPCSVLTINCRDTGSQSARAANSDRAKLASVSARTDAKAASSSTALSSKTLSLRRILCPTDFSAGSYTALETASDVAEKFDAELCVLHVMEALEPMLEVVSREGLDAARSAEAAHEIQRAEQKYVSSTVRTLALVESGEPAEQILNVADKEQVDLIVTATHGLTGWRHFVFGSVAEAVVRQARQPVLTVRRGPETSVGQQNPER